MNPLLSHALIGLATLVLGVCVGYTISDRKRFPYQVVQNVSVAIISLLAMTLLLVSTSQYQKKAECQSLYNKAFTSALAERASISDQERAAARKMIASVLNPTGTVESRTKAIQTWDDDLAALDKKREETPIPSPPECIED